MTAAARWALTAAYLPIILYFPENRPEKNQSAGDEEKVKKYTTKSAIKRIRLYAHQNIITADACTKGIVV